MSQLPLATVVKIGGAPFPVRLGDTVFYYANCNYESTPQIGFVIKLQEEGIVDLSLVPHQGYRMLPLLGVHLVGDPRLDNPNIKSKGAWTPRPTPAQLGLV